MVPARQGVEQSRGDRTDVGKHGIGFERCHHTIVSPGTRRGPLCRRRGRQERRQRPSSPSSKVLASIAPLAARSARAPRGAIPNGRLVTSFDCPGGESLAHVAHSQDGDSHRATLRPAGTTKGGIPWTLVFSGSLAKEPPAKTPIRSCRIPSWNSRFLRTIPDSRETHPLENDNPYDVGMTGLIGVSSGYWALEQVVFFVPVVRSTRPPCCSVHQFPARPPSPSLSSSAQPSTQARGSLRFLTDDLSRPLVVTEPEKARLSQPAISRPFGESDLSDEIGPGPVRAAGDRSCVDKRRLGRIQLP